MNTIPSITNPLGAHWKQPLATSILLDDTHAVMDARAFDQLYEYSTSCPSGVYEGKMWKAMHRGQWVLRWYGECVDPAMCSNNQRSILVVV